jgi:hypothetical protein
MSIISYDGKIKKSVPVYPITDLPSLFLFSIPSLPIPNKLLIEFCNLAYLNSTGFLIKSCTTQSGTFNTEINASMLGGNNYYAKFPYTGANYFQIYLP